MMNEGVIALGSNINPKENIPAAIAEISNNFQLIKRSEFIFTKPLGYTDQPDFLNGTVLVQSPDDKDNIIDKLKGIEQQMGRRRTGRRDGPRKIDLDLVLFNDQILDADVYERDFLKHSIKQILPGIKLPRQ